MSSFFNRAEESHGSPTQVIDVSKRPGEDPNRDVVKIQKRQLPYTADLSQNRAVRTGSGSVGSVNICNGSAVAVVVTLWDNTTAATTPIRVYRIAAGASTPENPDIEFFVGLYVSIDTPSALVQINLSLS